MTKLLASFPYVSVALSLTCLNLAVVRDIDTPSPETLPVLSPGTAIHLVGAAEGIDSVPWTDRTISTTTVVTPGWVLPGALIDRDFANSRYFGKMPSISRASGGSAQNADGSWTQFGPGQLRASTKGLTVEERRTNYVYNNVASGGTISASAVGTGLNTPPNPTNWQLASLGKNLQTAWSAVGIENGVDYIDWHVLDTNITKGVDQSDVYWAPAVRQPIPATPSDVVQVSLFAKVSKGSWSHVQTGGFNAAIDQFSNGDPARNLKSYLGTANANIGRPFSSTRLGVNRLTGSFTPKAHAVAIGADSGIVPDIGTNGLAFDITVRWGWHQIEFGDFPTTPIRTSGNAPATREADIVTSAFSGIASGTILIAAITASGIGSSNQVLWQWDDGTENNRIRVVRDSARILRCIVTRSGAELVNFDMGKVLDNTAFELAFTWSTELFAAVLNGGSELTWSSGVVPLNLETIREGADSWGNYWNGIIARAVIFPTLQSTSWRQTSTSTWVGTNLSVDSYQYLQRASIATSDERAAQYEALIRALQTTGVWTKLDRLYVLAASDSWEARQNLINSNDPLSLGAAKAMPAFEVNRGFKGDGSFAYLQTTFDPSAAGQKWMKDSASIFAWNLTSGTREANALLGVAQSRLVPYSTGNFAFRVNSNSGGSVSNADSAGFYVASRTATTLTSAYKDGKLLGTDPTPSVPAVRSKARVLSNIHTFTPNHLAVAGFGGGLSAGDVTNLYKALQAYLHAVGAL